METGIPRPGLHDGGDAFARLLPLAVYGLYPCHGNTLFGELAEGADGMINFRHGLHGLTRFFSVCLRQFIREIRVIRA